MISMLSYHFAVSGLSKRTKKKLLQNGCILKTIQKSQNPKRLSNWALNISSRAFCIHFILCVVLYVLSTHGDGILGADIRNTSKQEIFEKRSGFIGQVTCH